MHIFLFSGISLILLCAALLLLQKAEGKSLCLLSIDVRFKRLSLADFQDVLGLTTSAPNFNDGVTLKRVVLCQDGEDLVKGSTAYRWLRLKIDRDKELY